MTAYADWFTVSGKTVTLVVSEGNRAAINSQILTVTVVNTLDNSAPSVNKDYTFTISVLRAECDSIATITNTAITFADPFITADYGTSSTTGTFTDAGYTIGLTTNSEVCGPRTYAVEESTVVSTWVSVAAPAIPGQGTTYTVTADATTQPASAGYTLTLKITSSLHPSRTASEQTFKVKVRCGTVATFAPNPTTAGTATYSIPAAIGDAMPAAESITIPNYD